MRNRILNCTGLKGFCMQGWIQEFWIAEVIKATPTYENVI
jgi:hypothetical protein